MTSAFGIEHGDEVSKLAVPKLKMPNVGGSLNSVKNFGSGAKTAFKAGGHDFTPMRAMQGNKSFLGGARAGNFAQANKKPLAIGGAAGAAGIGGGSLYGRRNRNA